MGDIYIIKNDFNNKVYIGKAKNGAKKRWYEHTKRDIYNGQYIHNSILDHGIEHFYYEILETNIPDILLNEKEKYYIKKYNCKFPNGYNLTDGGDGGGDAKAPNQWCKEHPEEAKKNRDKARNKAWQWQKENPELFKNIIKQNQTYAAKAKKIPVLCIETGIIYESGVMAAKEIGLSGSSHITAVCKGTRKTAGGYHWKYYIKEQEGGK